MTKERYDRIFKFIRETSNEKTIDKERNQDVINDALTIIQIVVKENPKLISEVLSKLGSISDSAVDGFMHNENESFDAVWMALSNYEAKNYVEKFNSMEFVVQFTKPLKTVFKNKFTSDGNTYPDQLFRRYIKHLKECNFTESDWQWAEEYGVATWISNVMEANK